MKRSFKNLFMIIAILAASFASNFNVTPVAALSRLTPISGMPGLPIPPGGPSPLDQGYLNGVWGADEDHVFAVGYGDNGPGTVAKPVIYQTTNGTNWTSYSPSLPAGLAPEPDWGTGILQAVWGADATHAYAVGKGGVDETTLPLVSTWDGSNWSADDSLDLPSDDWKTGELYGVWGTTVGTTTHVWAVGYGGGLEIGTNIPLAFHWNGSGWSSEGLPLPGGYDHAYLAGVWGTSNTNIYAAGRGEDSRANNKPLLYQYNGSTWGPITLDLPEGWSWGKLDGIWGSGEDDIYAVGAGNNGTMNVPLIYHWDGANWTSSSPSLPTSYWTNGYLYGVWGVGADVYAVGYGFNGQPSVRLTSPLLYRKTSNGWAAASYPPSGWGSGFFQGVWGSDADHIYAVGFGDHNTKDVPLLSYGGLDEVAPGPVVGLTATEGTLVGSVRLDWTAPADDVSDPPDPNAGPVTSYVVTYSESAADLTTCTSGTPLPDGSTLPTPVAPGQPQTMTVIGLTAGTLYYFAVCAQDEASPPNQSSVQVTSGTAQVHAIYDDADENWTYSGFTATTTTGPYLGTMHYSKVVGSEAQFPFVGAQIKLTYSKYSNRGKLAVYIDDDPTPIVTIDEYSATRVWQSTWTSGDLGLAPHTVRLVHSSGAQVDIDAIEIREYESPGPGKYDDVHLGWKYSGFIKTTTTGPYLKTLHYSKVIGNYAEFAFTGSQIILTYSRYTNRGKLAVYLDGAPTPIATLNQYNSKRIWQSTWKSGYLGPGGHTVRLVHATGAQVDVDAIEVKEFQIPSLGKYDNTHEAWTYSGFTATTATGPYKGTMRYSKVIGSYAQFTFTGSQIILWFSKYSNRGEMEVYIDGNPVPIDTIDTYNATRIWQSSWASGDLGPGQHTIRFVHASGAQVDVDAIEVKKYQYPVVMKHDDNVASWTYNGFTLTNTTGPYLGTMHYSKVVGNYAQFSITGRQVTLTYSKYSNRGKLEVYIDGALDPVATIDQYSSTRVWQAEWTSDDLGAGPHTVRLVHASGAQVDVDALTDRGP